jgi:hypothetical protein
MDSMVWLSQKYWLAFGLGLLSTAGLDLGGGEAQAEAESLEANQISVDSLPKELSIDDLEQSGSPGSQFDRLFGRWEDGERTYDIPFPFSALAEKIAATLAHDEGKPSPIVQVLIPLGRSLHRGAAEPDFFKYPRVILAVVGDPAQTSEREELFLKDRLYLGYQEKAQAIEVISYDEEAGRFEFQVVKDFAPGLNPEVSDASRPVCMACHQNGGPIWSEPPWGETNANPRIASLLREESESFYGVPVRLTAQGTDSGFRIAESVERANLFAAHQQLWQLACRASAACRGDLFAAMLKYRLSGKRGYDPTPAGLEKIFMTGWRAHWPDGLAVPNPRIPNRDPVQDMTDIIGDLDPLEPRLPAEFLKPSAAGRVIAGLSEFLPRSDLQTLDDYLLEAGKEKNVARRGVTVPCAFTKTEIGSWAHQVRFSCGGAGTDQLIMEGQIYIERGKSVHGTVERLSLNDSEKLIKLGLSGPEVPYAESSGEVILTLEQPIGAIHARLMDGSLLETLTLQWNRLAEEDVGPSDELIRHPDNGTATLSIVDDFSLLREALGALVQKNAQGTSDALSEKPIRGRLLMRELFAEIGR